MKIALFGPFRSGTTALFYKIKNSLAVPPRTLFEPQSYVAHQDDNQRGVLAKVILGAPDLNWHVDYAPFLQFDRKILLIRDPRDLVISGMLFMIQQIPTLYLDDDKIQDILKHLREKEAHPDRLSVIDLLSHIASASETQSLETLRVWLIRQYQWLPAFEARLDDYVHFKYEDLIDDKLEGLETYLGFALKGQAVVGAKQDHVGRTQSYGNWRHWFLQEDVDYFKPVFETYLKRYGYGDAWDIHPVSSLAPEHGSAYVVRTVNRRRAMVQAQALSERAS